MEPRGRPRSEAARRAVLDAALMLCERDGYSAVTVKGIADTAGVGRQTVYRWWSTKAEVLIEALRELAVQATATLSPDTGDTFADVQTLLTATFDLTTRVSGKAVAGLMADAQSDPELSIRLRDTVIGPRRQALRAILERGVTSGALRETVSLDLAVDFAFGAMWYRLMNRHAPIDTALAGEITAALRLLLGAG